MKLEVRSVLAAAATVFIMMSSASAEPGTGTLYGTVGATGDLIQINPLTGAGALIGPTGRVMPALATDPMTGVLYGGRGQGSPELYTINTSTGAATLVGNTGLGFSAISDMDFSPTGVLYASVNTVGDGGTGADHLAIIDKSTAATTIVGSYGICTSTCTLEGIEAIAFASDGTLYGASAKGTGICSLFKINTTTGLALAVAPIVDANGSAPPGGIAALRFGCDAKLYGGTARTSGAADGGDLVTIDPLTGVFTKIGKSVAGGTSLAALAFANACMLGVESSSWGHVKTLYR